MQSVSCLEDDVNTCERQSECVTLRIWKELNDAIKSVVDKYTLEDLMEWQQDISSDYVI